MMFKVNYVCSDGQSFSYHDANPDVFRFMRALEKCEIKSFSISDAEVINSFTLSLAETV